MLQLPYDGPFAVVTVDDKNFTIRMHSKNITVSINRIKSVFQSLTDTGETINSNARQDKTQSIGEEQSKGALIPEVRTGMVTRQKSSISRAISDRQIIPSK